MREPRFAWAGSVATEQSHPARLILRIWAFARSCFLHHTQTTPMGPRLISRGKASRTQEHRSLRLASMGPRLIIRGKLLEAAVQ